GRDDEVAGGGRPRLGDEILELAPTTRRTREPVAEDVLLAEQGQAVGREALFERQDREPDGRMRQARERRAAGEPAQIGEAMLAQYGCEPVRGTLAVGRDRGMPALLAFGIQILADSVEQIGVGVGALGGKILGRPRPGIKAVGAALLGRAKWREPDDGTGAQPLFPFRVIEEPLLGSDRAI